MVRARAEIDDNTRAAVAGVDVLREACTDAFPLTQAANAFPIMDPNPTPWELLGGEVADLCSGSYHQYANYLTTQVWSNMAVAAGGDPCVPADPGPYFNVSPTPSDVQYVTAGQTIMFTITGWSTGPLPAWSVYPLANGTFMPQYSPQPLTLNNGLSGILSVSVPAGTPSGSYAVIDLYSTANMQSYNQWPLALVVQ